MTTWKEGLKRKRYPSLRNNTSVDTVIIGGGITGIVNAYLLSQAGQKVALLECAELGSNATLETIAFITQVIDTDLSKVADIYDSKTAKLIWQSGQEAIDHIEQLIKKENIECEFMRCSNYIYAKTHKQWEELGKEFKMYKRLNLPAEINEYGSNLNFPNHGYIEIPRQAKFHPGKYIYSVAAAAVKLGARIFENTKALDISGDGPVKVKTKNGNILAKNVVIATYKPFTHEKTNLKKALYRSYILEVEIPKDILVEGIYEDNSNPYYYFRIDRRKDKDRMIVGGEDHKDIFGKTLRKKSFDSLKKFVANILPEMKYKIKKKWDGPILEPSDGLALIGEIKPNYYVATAFSGNGMTYSMISAILIRDLILNKPNPWIGVYDPTRPLLVPKRLSSKAKDYIEEFFGGALKNILR